MIKVIIFDAGGVILLGRSYVKYLHEKLGLSPKQLAKLKELSHMAERGEMGSKMLRARISKELGIPILDLEWIGDRGKAQVNQQIRTLIVKLSKGYKVVLLTNMVKDIYIGLVRDKLLERELFDEAFVSAYIKMSKPNAEIYRFVLKRINSKPEEVVFIDDKLENVEAAKKLGINALQYTSYAKLERDLLALEIKW